jgi:hypothetical protein
MKPNYRIALIGSLLMASGCAANAPYPEKVVEIHREPEVVVSARAFPRVGNALPVKLSVTNKRPIARSLRLDSVIAVTKAGDRLEPMPADETSRAAGNADTLRNSLPDSSVGGKAAVAPLEGMADGMKVGIGLGAGGGGNTALGGAMVGGGVGLILGTVYATRLALSPDARLETVMLTDTPLKCCSPVEAYVFYPAGEYRDLEVGVINHERLETETITIPWSTLEAGR